MVDSLIDAARQPILDLAADIHGSLVYLDAGAAEVAELTLGPAFLLGACLPAFNVVCTPLWLLWTHMIRLSLCMYELCG